ncbi:hypothetical protein ACJRO7_018956 [Eucalyptus globulus]|uniref:3'-5' exonuclease domain-containing protein n=1 Tax=Eucalyptus globulus TaxID=34317 RepID=A0ABD3KVK1_EUCGL
MHSLHNITFYGHQIYTCVTDDPSIVTRWIMEVEHAHLLWLNWLVIGLDIEGRPNLEPCVVLPVATLQLCVGRSCLVFQILQAEYIPASLHAFLRNLNYTFVGGGRTHHWVIWARINLLKSYFIKDLEMPKEITLSHWEEKTLTARQVEHACLDAFVTFELGMALQGLVGKARVGWCAGANCVMVPNMVAPFLPRQVFSRTKVLSTSYEFVNKVFSCWHLHGVGPVVLLIPFLN